jgi:hypothetical protein
MEVSSWNSLLLMDGTKLDCAELDWNPRLVGGHFDPSCFGTCVSPHAPCILERAERDAA